MTDSTTPHRATRHPAHTHNTNSAATRHRNSISDGCSDGCSEGCSQSCTGEAEVGTVFDELETGTLTPPGAATGEVTDVNEISGLLDERAANESVGTIDAFEPAGCCKEMDAVRSKSKYATARRHELPGWCRCRLQMSPETRRQQSRQPPEWRLFAALAS